MSLITVELPESLYMKITELSEAEGISANQFLVLAAAEKMSAILTENYLEEEARKGRREDFEKVMKAVPCVEPDEHDRIIWKKHIKNIPVLMRVWLSVP